MARPILGPTFDEMLHPQTIDPATRARALAAQRADPLDPVNLYNITWRGADNEIKYEVLPRELTGVDAPIVVLYGRDFPTGAHKVGAAYSVLAEQLAVRPGGYRPPHRGLAQHRQLRHRRRLGGRARGRQIHRGAAGGHEPRALRADRALRRAGDQDARRRSPTSRRSTTRPGSCAATRRCASSTSSR